MMGTPMLEGFTQALLDAVPDALLIVDGQSHHISAANKVCQELLQSNAPDIGEISFLDLLPPSERERGHSYLNQVGNDGNTCVASFTIMVNDERRIPCDVHSRLVEQGTHFIVHTLHPLDGPAGCRKGSLDADGRQREAELRSRALLKALPDPIFRLSSDGVILDYKHGGSADVLLLSPDQIIGSSIFDLPLDDADKSRIRQIMAQTIESGELRSTEYAVTVSGKRRLFEARFVAEEEARVVGIVREITSQRHSEEALARIEKLEALGILAAGIAHDFNNLVAGAFGHVEMAREYIIEDKVTSAVDCLAEAAATFNRARELTRQLLTFSKGGAPQKKLGNLAIVVRRVIEKTLGGSNVVCQFKEESPEVTVPFDESQITQVLESLATNARQAMPLGGTLEVTLTVVPISVGAALPLAIGTYTRISLKDSGEGIPLENMPKLFDPFFTTKKGGTGLGLASSFSIVKRHGGHLDIESELGGGTTCHIYVPHDVENLAEPRNVTSNRPTRQGRILVMDDEDSVRRVTCALLMRLGYEVVPSADGAEAIEIYRRSLTSGNRFAFVILDLTVPGGLGGRETLASISEMDPNVIAIATTGYSNDPILSNPEAYGFRAGLAKPYSRQEFIGLIGRVTG
jgi:two-component system, cell cycle sensor histidine kinase and response regulator CckA